MSLFPQSPTADKPKPVYSYPVTDLERKHILGFVGNNSVSFRELYDFMNTGAKNPLTGYMLRQKLHALMDSNELRRYRIQGIRGHRYSRVSL